MGELKKWQDLALPFKQVKLWNGKEDATVYVRTIPASKQLQIYEEVQKHYGKKQNKEGDSPSNRDLMYNMMLSYECTRDAEGNRLGSYEEFCNHTDGESIQRISQAYNQLVIAKSYFGDNITEDDFNEFVEFVESVGVDGLDGVVYFHLDKIIEHLKSIKSKFEEGEEE